MTEERDLAFQELQRGNTSDAVRRLELVCKATPQDYLAQMYLGAAYGQSGRHMDAVSALTQAVTLQPENAQARFNLAVAMERAGYVDQAIVVYQQALMLQPNYPKATQALQKLEAVRQPPAAAPTIQGFGQQPGATLGFQPPQQVGTTGYQQPTQSMPPQGPQYPGPAGFQQAPQSGQPQGLAGYQQAPQSGQPQGLAGYQSQGAPGYAQPSPYGPPPGQYNLFPYQQSYGPAPVDDEFSLTQAFVDWYHVLVMPRSFWQEQVGREGIRAPSANIVAYGLISMATAFLIMVVPRTMNSNIQTSGLMGLSMAGSLCALPFMIGFSFIGYFIMAGCIHVIGMMFGNRSSYSASYRALVYGMAPMAPLSALAGAVALLGGPTLSTPVPTASRTPTHITAVQYQPPQYQQQQQPFQQPDSQQPGVQQPQYGSSRNSLASLVPQQTVFSALIRLAGLIWSLVLLGVGIKHMQQISDGGAVGVVLILGGSCCLLTVLAGIGMAGLAAGALH